VEPSPAGGYFVRLRGEPAPLSRHDTEEEAEAAAAAYERGLQAPAPELVVLDDGSEVLVRETEQAIEALDHDSGERVAFARYTPDPERPHVAAAEVEVTEAWRRRGLGRRLTRRLGARAAEQRIRIFTRGHATIEIAADPDALANALRAAAAESPRPGGPTV
jgi:GNAT superfamily N-acetyltransferase